MKKFFVIVWACSYLIPLYCYSQSNAKNKANIRYFVDTVGFATHQYQMDSILSRIEKTQIMYLEDVSIGVQNPKVTISPHDDYTYVGYLYPAIFKNIKAKHVIVFGVAHKAKKLGIEDKIVFDNYDAWDCPYGNVSISPFRQLITDKLDKDIFSINDSLQKIEHSVEALLPFLQHYDPQAQITSVLVPYMSFERLDQIAYKLAGTIYNIASEKGWKWGEDYTLLISNDAVHYGDEDWGTSDLNIFGGDTLAYEIAGKYDNFLINNWLARKLNKSNIEALYRCLNNVNDYKKSRWAWCGRYSVPMGLMTAYYLEKKYGIELTAYKIGYANSIDHPHIPVDDLKMGKTAPANIHHWVAYLGMEFK